MRQQKILDFMKEVNADENKSKVQDIVFKNKSDNVVVESVESTQIIYTSSRKLVNYNPTIFVHPKADPREPREYSESKKKEVKTVKNDDCCVIL